MYWFEKVFNLDLTKSLMITMCPEDKYAIGFKIDETEYVIRTYCGSPWHIVTSEGTFCFTEKTITEIEDHYAYNNELKNAILNLKYIYNKRLKKK